MRDVLLSLACRLFDSRMKAGAQEQLELSLPQLVHWADVAGEHRGEQEAEADGATTAAFHLLCLPVAPLVSVACEIKSSACIHSLCIQEEVCVCV